MPELPEVETTTRGLKKILVGKTIKNVWTDWPKYYKKGRSITTEKDFKNCVVGKKIKDVTRLGKNIIFELSGGHLILIHQKMTGHLLIGEWVKNQKNNQTKEGWSGEKWIPDASKNSSLWDSKNRFIRLLFSLSGKSDLAFSDVRRFGKILCGPKKEIMNLSDIKNLGPDPTDKGFTFKKFKKLFNNKRGAIKRVLMDQKFLVGIGNIYADEILWKSKLHPKQGVEELSERSLRAVYDAIKKILKKAIKLKGTSIDDYRDPSGELGRFAGELNAYQREGEPCPRCKTKIKRIKIGNRSAHFCPECQTQPNSKH